MGPIEIRRHARCPIKCTEAYQACATCPLSLQRLAKDLACKLGRRLRLALFLVARREATVAVSYLAKSDARAANVHNAGNVAMNRAAYTVSEPISFPLIVARVNSSVTGTTILSRQLFLTAPSRPRPRRSTRRLHNARVIRLATHVDASCPRSCSRRYDPLRSSTSVKRAKVLSAGAKPISLPKASASASALFNVSLSGRDLRRR